MKKYVKTKKQISAKPPKNADYNDQGVIECDCGSVVRIEDLVEHMDVCEYKAE